MRYFEIVYIGGICFAGVCNLAERRGGVTVMLLIFLSMAR